MKSLRHAWSSGIVATMVLVLAALAMLITASPAAARGKAKPLAGGGTCLKDVYKKNLQCTANDVRVAYADNVRKLDGTPLGTCNQGETFSFIADFHIVTTATQRENIGLYFQTAGGSSALTGTCSDNIISPLHYPGLNDTNNNSCGGAGQVPCLGSADYHEFDTSLLGDNCGDTTSADGSQIVTVEVDNALCTPGANGFVALPDCTSWQQPGGALLCESTPPNSGWPWVPAAIPGAPSKCHCDNSLTVPVQVQSPGFTVSKKCSTDGGSTYTTACSIDDPGGTVNYEIVITNDSNFGTVSVNRICDNAYGTIATSADQPDCPTGITGIDGTATPVSCSLPQSIAFGGSYTCTFTANATEQYYYPSVSDVATAYGLGADGKTGFSKDSNSVTVNFNEAATTATTAKSVVSTQAGCVTVRYGVSISNTSSTGADESLTLQQSAPGATPPIIALSDSSYGDVTVVHGNVLGTTCGVAVSTYGLGSMAQGQPGALVSSAGTLPATINPGSSYSCQFDAQFCGQLGSVDTSKGTCTGLQHIDTITPALLDDEGGAFTNNSNTLTVSECFSTDVESK